MHANPSRHMFRHCRALWAVLAGLTVGIMAMSANAAAEPVCPLPPALLRGAPPVLLQRLEVDAAAMLAAADDYAAAMEGCYDGPLGPLQLAAPAAAAEKFGEDAAAVRQLAEARIAGDEAALEALLGSSFWGDIEALRVAAGYAAAWARLAQAVRQVTAEDRRQALATAHQALQKLTFEFKHPQVVQRAMYGLATAELEAGNVDAARRTLARLQASLKRGGAADFSRAVDEFAARLEASGFRPPPVLPSEGSTEDTADPSKAAAAVSAARNALKAGRDAAVVMALLQPAFGGTDAVVTAAFDLVARDALLVAAATQDPVAALQALHMAYDDNRFADAVRFWPRLTRYYDLMPVSMRRQLDSRLGTAYLNLGRQTRAEVHLAAARNGLPDGLPAAIELDKMLWLARFSGYSQAADRPTAAPVSEAAKHEALLTAARAYAARPLPAAAPRGHEPPPPDLDVLLALHSRLVLARQAAEAGDFAAAENFLTGVTPATPGHRLVLGMRVRLLAEAVKSRRRAGASASEVATTARGTQALYRLWLGAACPPGCPTGEPRFVHRAALSVALMAELSSPQVGLAWGHFEDAGGDRRPFVAQAVAHFVRDADAERLTALLTPAETEADFAAFVLQAWKKFLAAASAQPDMDGRYQFLATDLMDLQGRPQAALLEALAAHDLEAGRPAAALAHAEKLAAAFPRRPGAWFTRASALQANRRTLEAARSLSVLARQTPADDPVGMSARLGLAAVFVAMDETEKACQMQAKTLSRRGAAARRAAAAQAFPQLTDWEAVLAVACAGGVPKEGRRQ